MQLAGHPVENEERLGRPMAVSVALHGGLAALFLVTGLLHHKPMDLGDPNNAAGSVSLNPVKTIPLTRREGPVNPLASATESTVPQQPVPLKDQRPQRVAEPEKAVELPTKMPKRMQPKPDSPVQYRPSQEKHLNQVYSKAAPAMVSPQMSKPGGGGVSVGPASPFGTRFGAYAQQIRDIIASHWNTADISASPSVHAVVTLQIQRDGSVRAVALSEASGSYTLDTSARRAVLESNPLPPLPSGFDKSSADVELWFQLQR